MSVRALVLEGEGKPALAAVRSLGRAGYEVDVAASGRWARSLVSRHCRQGFQEPASRSPEAWCAFLLERLKAGRYDVLLMMGQSSAERVSAHRERFLPHVRIVLPCPESFAVARDKSRTMRFAQSLGVPIPCTLFPGDRTEARSIARSLAYPVVVKGPSGSGCSRVRFASTPEQLVERYDELAQLGEADGDLPPIVQEVIRGEALCYAGLMQEGRPLVEFMWRRLLEYPATGGPTATGESLHDASLAATGRTICQALRWSGPVSVEFKRDRRDGVPRLIEINPRFWGPLELAIRCGVDFPRLYVEQSFGRPFTPVLTYPAGRRLSFLGDRILLCQSTHGGWLTLLRDLARLDRFDVDWSDLRPTFRDLRATWWDLRSLGRTGPVAR